MSTWTDHRGRQWRTVESKRRLKFCNPSHAALRAFVHHRDGYRCAHCHVAAELVPGDYSGRYALPTTDRDRDGFPVLLVLDHRIALCAGGSNSIDNFQTLCGTCNGKKVRADLEDKLGMECEQLRRKHAWAAAKLRALVVVAASARGLEF